MKLICVDFPFEVSRKFYPNMKRAAKASLGIYAEREKNEDDGLDQPADGEKVNHHASRELAKVYEVDVVANRALVCDILNGCVIRTPDNEKLVALFKYRGGKIVTVEAAKQEAS